MYNNLPELMEHYPIGTKIPIAPELRYKYYESTFVVNGYIYEHFEKWYPARKLWNGQWEIYED